MDDAFLLFQHALLLLKITNYEFLAFETTVFILYHFSGELRIVNIVYSFAKELISYCLIISKIVKGFNFDIYQTLENSGFVSRTRNGSFF